MPSTDPAQACRERVSTLRLLLAARRDGTFLWYSANMAALQELLGFLYAECCTRNRVIEPSRIVCCK